MTQILHPDDYAKLELDDQFIENLMQETEARWLIEQTEGFENVIDLGWGSGIVAKALKAAGRSVVVIEGAEASVDEARRCGIAAVHSLFEDFDPDGAHDCAVASFVLEHIEDPVALLKRMTQWVPRLLVVVGNAQSWHRRLAVKMGIQPELNTLSPRDNAVGHYRVYDFDGIAQDLGQAGWRIKSTRGLMFKPLPNSMMMHFDERLIRAMCEVEIATMDAANMGIVCERV